MNDPDELQDTLAAIQAELDKTVALINRAVSGGPRRLLDVAQQLKVARTYTVDAQLHFGVVPKDYQPPKTTQIQRVRPGPLEQVMRRKSPKSTKGKTQPKPVKQKSSVTSNSVDVTVPKALPERYMTTCPVCKVEVWQHRLPGHISRVHPQAARSQAPASRTTTPVQRVSPDRSTKQKARKGTSVSPKSQAYLSSSNRDHEESLEALDQSYRDRRDGGKELSQSRRDHGQYGSLPVHDDYSEDSFA